MIRKLRNTGLTLAVCATASLGVSVAVAAAQKGVLGTGADPSTGVVDPDAPGGATRYTALPAGRGTVVTKLDTDDGRVGQHRYVDRRLVVPSVAYDGSPDGLSADGGTLVLAQPGLRFPQRRSEFAVLDTRRLRLTETVVLNGTFTFDAISPDGRSLYLIEYTSPRDLTEYRVREYDLVREGFNPRPIIDPNESGEDMYGSPVTRTTSPNGRWAYTLYDGREHPFIHALDTKRGTAVCIDLESLHRIVYGSTGLEPSPDGSTLTVVNGPRPIEVVDTETFEVRPVPATPDSAPDAAGGGRTVAWIAIGGGALLLVGGTLAIRRHRRSPGSIAGEDLERLVEGDGGEAEPSREREPVA
jgi:hypothetical protein